VRTKANLSLILFMPRLENVQKQISVEENWITPKLNPIGKDEGPYFSRAPSSLILSSLDEYMVQRACMRASAMHSRTKILGDDHTHPHHRDRGRGDTGGRSKGLPGTRHLTLVKDLA